MHQIAPGIYIENSFPGVTLGAIALAQGTILIDAPLRGEDTRSWRMTLINQGCHTNRILVNLDSHPDRTLGARALECTIVAHQKTAAVFRSRPSVFKGQSAESGSDWESYNEAVGTRWAIPDVTFTQRIFLHWGPPDVILEHHPGPTQGSIWAIVPDQKVVFVGDAVIFNQPPFLANADIPAWLEALDLLKSNFREYTIISGRGGPVPNEAVHCQHTILKSILKGLEKYAKSNNTAEVTEKLIPGLMAELSYPPHLGEQYEQRFRHGLSQYYNRRYRPQDISNQAKVLDTEQ